MKKWIALLFQGYMLTRCPSNLGMEAPLAGRAMRDGMILYKDFPCHYGPIMPILFWAVRPGLIGIAVIYGIFNLFTAWGIYKISQDEMAAILFLFIKPFFFGDAWNVETAMICFGVWAFYFSSRNKWICSMFVIFSFLTKQTGALYSLCLIG